MVWCAGHDRRKFIASARAPLFSPMAGRYIIRAGAVDVCAVDPSRLRVSDRVVGNSTSLYPEAIGSYILRTRRSKI